MWQQENYMTACVYISIYIEESPGLSLNLYDSTYVQYIQEQFQYPNLVLIVYDVDIALKGTSVELQHVSL